MNKRKGLSIGTRGSSKTIKETIIDCDAAKKDTRNPIKCEPCEYTEDESRVYCNGICNKTKNGKLRLCNVYINSGTDQVIPYFCWHHEHQKSGNKFTIEGIEVKASIGEGSVFYFIVDENNRDIKQTVVIDGKNRLLKSPREQLNSQGYVLFESILTAADCLAIKKQFEEIKRSNGITNAAEISTKKNTTGRYQKFLPMDSVVDSKVQELLKPVKLKIQEELGFRKENMGTGPEGVSLLHNSGEVPEQVPHTDYGPSIDICEPLLENEQDTHLDLPAIAIITLDNDTPFNTWPGHINLRHKGGKLQFSYDVLEYRKKRVVIPKLGSVFVFRGDLIHSGAYNDKENQRLHMNINRQVRGSSFTVRTSAAIKNSERGENWKRYFGKQTAAKAQCSKTPFVQYFSEPGEDTTEIKSHDELVEMDFKDFKLYDKKENHVMTISQKYNFPPVISEVNEYLEGGTLEASQNKGFTFTVIATDTQGSGILPQGTMFGPNSLLYQTIRVKTMKNEIINLDFHVDQKKLREK